MWLFNGWRKLCFGPNTKLIWKEVQRRRRTSFPTSPSLGTVSRTASSTVSIDSNRNRKDWKPGKTGWTFAAIPGKRAPPPFETSGGNSMILCRRAETHGETEDQQFESKKRLVSLVRSLVQLNTYLSLKNATRIIANFSGYRKSQQCQNFKMSVPSD